MQFRPVTMPPATMRPDPLLETKSGSVSKDLERQGVLWNELDDIRARLAKGLNSDC